MTYLIAKLGTIIEVTDVVEVKETDAMWHFVKADGSLESHSKFLTDFLGLA